MYKAQEFGFPIIISIGHEFKYNIFISKLNFTLGKTYFLSTKTLIISTQTIKILSPFKSLIIFIFDENILKHLRGQFK